LSSRTLILLRHGKSDWSTGDPDVRRPLADRGRRQAADSGRWLAAHVDHVDVALVSPAERTSTTWDLVSAELPTPPPVRMEERAYAATAGTLLDLVRNLPDDLGTVVLVGHNPGLEDLVETLTGRWVLMKTSGLAVVELRGSWSSAGRASAELRASGRPPPPGPKLLGG
jgi:phosphohistidine phosphatase